MVRRQFLADEERKDGKDVRCVRLNTHVDEWGL